jgi:carbonic anhydrase
MRHPPAAVVAHTDCGAMDSAGSPFRNKDSCLPMAVSMAAKIPAQLSSI